MGMHLRSMAVVCSLAAAGCSATCINGGTAIDSVPYAITKPGAYCLVGSLQAKAGTDGITVLASNVTVDLAGHALLGYANAGKAIYAPRTQTNLAIHDGTITGWGSTGLFAPNVQGGHYERLRISSDLLDGMAVGPHSIVDGCSVLWNGEREEIERDGVVQAQETGDGILVGRSSVVRNSIVYGNKIDGVVTLHGGTVSRSTIEDKGRAGIWAMNGGTVVTENVLLSNHYGVLASKTYNRIDGNHVRFNHIGIAALNFDSVTRNEMVSNGTNITGGPQSGFGPNGAARTTGSPWANELR